MVAAIRWTEQRLAEFQQNGERRRQSPVVLPPAKERRKYGNVKVEEHGLSFDSKKEARRWAELNQMAAAGLISGLQRQVSFELAPSVKLEGEKRAKPALRYFSDASYMQDGRLVVEDTKSEITRKNALYRAKKHLMATVHGIHIKEI